MDFYCRILDKCFELKKCYGIELSVYWLKYVYRGKILEEFYNKIETNIWIFITFLSSVSSFKLYFSFVNINPGFSRYPHLPFCRNFALFIIFILSGWKDKLLLQYSALNLADFQEWTGNYFFFQTDWIESDFQSVFLWNVLVFSYWEWF